MLLRVALALVSIAPLCMVRVHHRQTPCGACAHGAARTCELPGLATSLTRAAAAPAGSGALRRGTVDARTLLRCLLRRGRRDGARTRRLCLARRGKFVLCSTMVITAACGMRLRLRALLLERFNLLREPLCALPRRVGEANGTCTPGLGMGPGLSAHPYSGALQHLCACDTMYWFRSYETHAMAMA